MLRHRPALESGRLHYDSKPHIGDIAAWNTGDGGLGHVAHVQRSAMASRHWANTTILTPACSPPTEQQPAVPQGPSEYVRIGTPAAQLLWKLRNTNSSSAADSIGDPDQLPRHMSA